MEPWQPGIDVEREHVLYIESLRRAGELGIVGRGALAEAHEIFAAAMLAAGEPERARNAVVALQAARPGCPTTEGLVARLNECLGRQGRKVERRLANVWLGL